MNSNILPHGGNERPRQRKGLHDLPNEIILLIIQGLPPAELFVLSVVSRRLHFIALPIYFDHYGIDIASGEVSLDFQNSYSRTKRALPGFIISLSITSLRHLSCNFSLRTQDFLMDTRGLRLLVSKLTTIEEVTFHLVPLNLGYAKVFSDGPEEWKDELLGLLEAIRGKSCKALNILRWEGSPDNIKTLRIPGRPFRPFSVLKRLFSLLREDAIKESKIMPTIKTFRTDSATIFLPAFLGWTTEILNSSSITRLSFDASLIFRSWNALLPLISLPNLSELAIPSSTVQLSDLSRFLLRHPTITSLNLRHNTLVEYSGSSCMSRRALPRLASLKGNPSDIAHILKRSCAFPTLSFISIATYTNPLVIYDEFCFIDDALASIARRTHDITLSLSFSDRPGLDKWLDVNSNVDSTHRVERSLLCVRRLELRLSNVELDVRKVLPTWLALFPALKEVRFFGCHIDPSRNPDATRAFVRSVGDACAGLISLKIKSDEYSLVTGLKLGV